MPLRRVMAIDDHGRAFSSEVQQAGGGKGGGDGISGVGEAFGGFGLAVDGVSGEHDVAGLRQGKADRQMARGVAGGGDQGQAVAKGRIGVDQAVIGGGPFHGPGGVEIGGARVCAFGAGEDDGAVGEQGQSADMVDVTVGQDQGVDIGGAKAEHGQRACNGLGGGIIDEMAEIIQSVGSRRKVRVDGIMGGKARIDQNACATVGFDQKAGDADGAACSHMEKAKVEHGKAADAMPCKEAGGHHSGRRSSFQPA